MAEWMTIPLGARCYQPRAGTTAIERLVNLYAEQNQPEAKTPVTLYGTPGLAEWSSVGDGPIRGLHSFGSDVYVVSGDELYAVDVGSKVATLIGTVPGVGAVRMADNGTHVVTCAVTDSYASNRTTHLWLPENNLCSASYQDGYVIYAQRGTQNFWVSGLDDATTINALDFDTADAFADNLVGLVSDHRELWLFGESTTEVWYNAGNATGTPFSRTGGGFMERGCISPGSIAKANNQVFWLGDDLTVYRAVGYQPEPISTTDIEKLITAATSPVSSEAFTYSQDGHTFYVLTFGDLTVAYDITTGLWHERASYNEPRWRVSAYSYTKSGAHLVGDYETGAIYKLDLDTYTDAGGVLQRIAQSPPLSTGARHTFLHEVYLDLAAGVGLSGGGQGSDPKVRLDWSDDDGRTWEGAIDVSMGLIGNYRHRATWARLGRFSNRTLRFTVADPVRVALLGAEARIEAGL
jgi:hypothetical protein